MNTRRKSIAPAKAEPPSPLMDRPAKPMRPEVHRARIEDGALKLEVDVARQATEQAAIDAAFGSDSSAFQAYIHTELMNILEAGREGAATTLNVNASYAMLAAIAPRDEFEGMLAAQLMATHHLAMRQLNKLAYAKELHLYEAHGLMANRLLRTFTMQMEALAKHRRGGKQVVEHVHVNSGGQAIVAGTVNTGGAGAK